MTTIDVEPQAAETGIAMLKEYWSMAARHKWIIMGCIVLSLSIAAIVSKVTPKIYRSETLILVEDQKISESYVKGVVEGNIEDRIFVIHKQITGHALLGEIAAEFQIYPDEVAREGPASAIARMAGAIRVELLGKGTRGSMGGLHNVDAFTVSFAHEDPATAMKVTSRLAAKFLEENMRVRSEIAEGTTEFLDAEVARAQSELERKEDEISQFKAGHMGELPQQMEANLRALDRLQSDLKTVGETMQRNLDRLALVQKGLNDYKHSGQTNFSLVAGKVETDPLFARLKDLREKLSKLKAEFEDTYPDVVLTKEELRQVEGKLVALYGPEAIKPERVKRDPYLEDLKKQQSELESEVALLKQRQSWLQGEKQSYTERVDRAPTVEQELLILMRDYENMKTNYQTLLDKRLNARVAVNLERGKKGSQFRIVDPANLPIVPEKPNQRLIMIFGLLAGFTLGFGIVVMRERMNPQFRRAEDIERVLGVRLLDIIPDFALDHREIRRQGLLPYRHDGKGTRAQAGSIRPRLKAMEPMPDAGGRDFPQTSLIAKWFPTSIAAEHYRVTATRLALSRPQERSTIVAVTSAVKGEGKTTTVLNLGYTLARDMGKRTLLVDCDFRCPMLHHYAPKILQTGLADCLTRGIAIEKSLVGLGDVPCWIMPVGNCENRSNELLKTDRLSDVFSQLRERFEYILINTPPVLAVADMSVIACHADVLFFVVRANSTPEQFVKRALSRLRTDMPIHVILNGVHEQSLPYYYMYGPEEPANLK